ncbi:thioredoxin-like protein [Syncephalis plumigaleata]|nr:thioredoxin-like protein [Syncephalis plumigaleata]
MALPHHFLGHRYGDANAPHLLEAYLDFVCPFSAKFFKRLTNEVLPWLSANHPGKVQFIFRHQIQPWHPQSTLVHEASLAAERVDRTKFFEVAASLFENQESYFDEALVNTTREETYQRLSEQLSKVLDKPALSIHAELAVPTTPLENIGNKVTNDLKWHIKYARQLGVHVSPTVYWDGIVDQSVSSGWTLDQWKEFIEKRLTA